MKTHIKDVEASLIALDAIFPEENGSVYVLVVLDRDGDPNESMHITTNIKKECVGQILSVATTRVLSQDPEAVMRDDIGKLS